VPRYLEDFEIGETWVSKTVEITEDEIIAYAKQNDPQPMHTDPEAAAKDRFGTVIASGYQIAALSMRLFIESGGYGDTPVIGMGVDELRWRKPVRPGDKLTVTREVISTERSKSRPEFGMIRTKVTVSNQNDEVVMTSIALGQVPARPEDQQL